MSAKWEKVQNVRAFLAERGKLSRGPHQFTKMILHWPYCARCGLIKLRNDVTRKSKVCEVEE